MIFVITCRYERRDIPQEIVGVSFMSEACIESLSTFPETLLKVSLKGFVFILSIMNYNWPRIEFMVKIVISRGETFAIL